MKIREKKAIVLGSGIYPNKKIKELKYFGDFKIKILGFFFVSKSVNRPIRDYPFLGKVENINRFIKKNSVDIIFIFLANPLDKNRLLRHIDYCLLKKTKILIEPTLWNPALNYLSCLKVGNISFLYLSYPLYFFVFKKYFDKLLAFITLVLFSPLFVFLFFIVKTLSPGPAIFKQIRIGQYGKIFTIYKFRTMKTGKTNKSTTPYQVQKNDGRLTNIGTFLRAIRLDELPQLFNVLKGDMSFSGPRPLVFEEVEKILEKEPLFKWRHLVKPGMTGLAQVSGDYYTKLEEKLNYDLLYIFNYSLLREILILVKTIKTIALAKGT